MAPDATRWIPRAIVLDFDGVILESVALKGEAFRRLLPGQPDLQDRIEQFHLQHLGLSRFDKFAWMYRELLHRPLPPEEMAGLERRFSASIATTMGECPFVTGAREFIERHTVREPMFIVSGTPEEELRSIVRDRGLSGFFSGVYGYPPTKADTLARIARDIGAACEELLFVGDGREDAQAADVTGVRFVARVIEGGPDEFGDLPVMRVADLAELDQRLPELTTT